MPMTSKYAHEPPPNIATAAEFESLRNSKHEVASAHIPILVLQNTKSPVIHTVNSEYRYPMLDPMTRGTGAIL
jgi:hypothetical protein